MRSWDVNFDMRIQDQHPEVVTLVAQARAFASVIRHIPITPSRQHKIDALNILRAVRGTTGIEGTELTEEEVRLIMDSPPNKAVLPPILNEV